MSAEHAFIELLRGMAGDPAARGLADDAAVLLPRTGEALVLTHDMLVEGVHFPPGCVPEDVAWKLVAVNLSDLAAKGAEPVGMLLGYMLGSDRDWDARFASGLRDVAARFGIALIGGDTTTPPPGGGRAYGLTAIGRVVGAAVPARDGARPGDALWASGTIGDAGLGLALARAGAGGPAALLDAYHRPWPRIAEGRAIVPLARASADISDGLLIDAGRMAAASGCGVVIELDAVPLSADAIALGGDDVGARIAAATAGDDYELLMAVAPAAADALIAAAAAVALPITRVGRFVVGHGVECRHAGLRVALPARLGFEHDGSS